VPVDDDLELGHDLEGTHRLENPQQCSLGRVVAARVSGVYDSLRSLVRNAGSRPSPFYQTYLHRIFGHFCQASGFILSKL
jgi:hypothetical protein